MHCLIGPSLVSAGKRWLYEFWNRFSALSCPGAVEIFRPGGSFRDIFLIFLFLKVVCGIWWKNDFKVSQKNFQNFGNTSNGSLKKNYTMIAWLHQIFVRISLKSSQDFAKFFSKFLIKLFSRFDQIFSKTSPIFFQNFTKCFSKFHHIFLKISQNFHAKLHQFFLKISPNFFQDFTY